jgi:pimeloyl-ACP methyl ester carboxylesterase
VGKTRPLAFTSQGSGPAVLLLHGQPGTAAVWSRVQPTLADAGLRAVAVDRPGYGHTGGQPAGFARNAQRAFQLLDTLRITDVTVVGHSWSGPVALAMALQQPHRVRGLVLQGSVGGARSVNLSDRILAAPVLGPLAVGAGLHVAAFGLPRPRIRHRIAPELDGLPEHRVTALTSAWKTARIARSVAHEQRSLIAELPVIEAQLSRVRTPVVVLIGRQDRVVPPASQRDLAARLHGAEVMAVDGGHLLAEAAAEAVTAAVIRVRRRRP